MLATFVILRLLAPKTRSFALIPAFLNANYLHGETFAVNPAQQPHDYVQNHHNACHRRLESPLPAHALESDGYGLSQSEHLAELSALEKVESY